MALTLVATPGSSTANTYITLADAENIVLEYLNMTAWSSATSGNKNIALVQATRDIDTKLRLDGEKYYSGAEGETDYQALHFPTSGDYNSSGALFIPENVERACVLQAVYLLRQSATAQDRRDLIDSGVTDYTIGNLSETLTRSGVSPICSEARALLAPWIIRTTRIERG